MARTLPKDTRWNMRVDHDADEAVRQAAELCQVNKTEFICEAAVTRAEHVLADRTTFVLSDQHWRKFVALLDRPERANSGLARLFQRPSVFE